MAAIIETLQRLNTSIMTRVPIIVKSKTTSVNEVIKVLVENKTIVILKSNTKEFLVKVTRETISLNTLHKLKSVKKAKINETVSQMRVTSKGYLVMSTSMGIMSHHQAIRRNLGGIILGIIN